jgi:hypothetical protein
VLGSHASTTQNDRPYEECIGFWAVRECRLEKAAQRCASIVAASARAVLYCVRFRLGKMDGATPRLSGTKQTTHKIIMADSTLTTFEFIKAASQMLRNPDCPSIQLWGATGVGKSTIVRQSIAEVSNPANQWKQRADMQEGSGVELIGDWGLIDLRVSLLEPSDLLGLPDLNGNIVRWVPPAQLPIIGHEDRFPHQGVLFLDELNHAPPAMQNACFSLVLDRRCGPHRLLPGWKIIAASNCAEDNGHTFPMPPPLRNRFAHFHIRCSLDAFKQWALQHRIDPRIVAFLNWNPTALHQPTDNPEESFPTPRSWTNASQLLRIFHNGHLEPAVASCVGPGTAAMFIAFLQLNESDDLKVDLLQVLRGKAKPPKLTMEKPDLAWALTSRLTGAVQESPALLSAAIGFYCTAAWKNVREIGRTGLADLKYLVSPAEFNRALGLHIEPCTKQYGGLLT